MRRSACVAAGFLVLAPVACGEGESPAPSIEEALAAVRPAFDAGVFDTLSWSSETAALERGQEVFEGTCQKCHGVTGAGEGGYVFGGQTLQPPSWIVMGWELAADPVGLRRYIYSGSVGGMPYWGLAGVSYRDVDAVSRYIVDVLRPTYGERPSGG